MEVFCNVKPAHRVTVQWDDVIHVVPLWAVPIDIAKLPFVGPWRCVALYTFTADRYLCIDRFAILSVVLPLVFRHVRRVLVVPPLVPFANLIWVLTVPLLTASQDVFLVGFVPPALFMAMAHFAVVAVAVFARRSFSEVTQRFRLPAAIASLLQHYPLVRRH